MIKKSSRALRIPMILLAALVCGGVPLNAFDAAAVGRARNASIMRVLTAPIALVGQVIRLPFRLVAALAKGASKAASKTVTDHITKD